ncbi:MAG: hypothetical protein N2505_00055 [Endomicrobia bacterium]|nr:hypothetical protein [Endomicrobiia bacterium]
MSIVNYIREIDAIYDLCFIYDIDVTVRAGYRHKHGAIPLFANLEDEKRNSSYYRSGLQYYGTCYDGKRGKLLDSVGRIIARNRKCIDPTIYADYYYSTFKTLLAIVKNMKNDVAYQYISRLHSTYHATKIKKFKQKARRMAKIVARECIRRNTTNNFYQGFTEFYVDERLNSFKDAKIYIST